MLVLSEMQELRSLSGALCVVCSQPAQVLLMLLRRDGEPVWDGDAACLEHVLAGQVGEGIRRTAKTL